MEAKNAREDRRGKSDVTACACLGMRDHDLFGCIVRKLDQAVLLEVDDEDHLTG